ncbi:hypothetical protein MMC25_004709 [Agyrium rufum]|nr:hypothetical protein [Agyrium rufum]
MAKAASNGPRTPAKPSGYNDLLVPDKTRLTEEEKKSNHIASEQKRRAAIREGFDRLADMTPGMAGQGRSEGLVLSSVVTYAKQQLEEKERLIRDLEARGVTV